jgi:TonB family protein
VLLEVLIGEAGEVAYARIRESVPQLDAAALDSVRRWKFEPMRIGDAVQATVIHLPLTFRTY